MEGRTVKSSIIIMTLMMNPQDANVAGNVHGGVIMKLIDQAASSVAVRHSRANVVTASVDSLDFHNPVFIGDLLTLKASLNLVGRTSMEIGVRVESENLKTGYIKHTASAYLTLVALGRNGRPMSVPPLVLETEEEMRRNHEAQYRRENRLRNKENK